MIWVLVLLMWLQNIIWTSTILWIYLIYKSKVGTLFAILYYLHIINSKNFAQIHDIILYRKLFNGEIFVCIFQANLAGSLFINLIIDSLLSKFLGIFQWVFKLLYFLFLLLYLFLICNDLPLGFFISFRCFQNYL